MIQRLKIRHGLTSNTIKKGHSMKQSSDYSSRFRILKGGKISLVVSAFLTSCSCLYASPTGGVVTSGTAVITTKVGGGGHY